MPKRKPIENRTPLAAWSIACRERYGWSQMTAADEAGIDQGYLSKIESGFIPSKKVITELARTFAGSDASDEQTKREINRALRAAGFVPDDEEYTELHQRHFANYNKLSPSRQAAIDRLIDEFLEGDVPMEG